MKHHDKSLKELRNERIADRVLVVLGMSCMFFLTWVIFAPKEKPKFILDGIVRGLISDCEDKGMYLEMSEITVDGFHHECVGRVGINP